MTSFQRLFSIGLSGTLLCNAASWLLVFLIDRSQPTVILHYNIYFGPDGFGSWPQLLFIPGIGLSIAALNFSLAGWLWWRDRFLSYVLAVLAGFVQIVLVVAMALIINANQR